MSAIGEMRAYKKAIEFYHQRLQEEGLSESQRFRLQEELQSLWEDLDCCIAEADREWDEEHADA